MVKQAVDGFRNRLEEASRNFLRTVFPWERKHPNPDASWISLLLPGGWETENVNPFFDPERGEKLFGPEDFSLESGPGNWVGAPSSEYDEYGDRLLLYFRLRNTEKRGFKAIIGTFEDGSFEKLALIRREDLDALSIEGAEIVENKGMYKLYLNYHPAAEGFKLRENWRIRRYEFESFEEFDPGKGEDLDLESDLVNPKNPVLRDGELYVWMNSRTFRNSRMERFNPETGEFRGEVEFGSFQEDFPRITSFLELDETFVLFDHRPSLIYSGEERSGFGVLKEGDVQPLIEKGEAIQSGKGSLRYVDATLDGDKLYFIFEKACEGSHALMVNGVPWEELLESFVTGDQANNL